MVPPGVVTQKNVTQKITSPIASSTPASQPININKILEVIRHQESRGQKNPYGFSQFSGKKEIGNANGAYQVTDAELKTYSKKYLGRDITPQEFLSNPKLQDQYMTSKVQRFSNMFNFTIPEIFGAHRGGIGGRSNPSYKTYIDEATKLYNTV
jgi:hypothetical protein